MALTKAGITKHLTNQLGLNSCQAANMVECFFGEIKQALKQGEEVKLSGFGNFIVKDKSARPGQNLQTGEKVTISARRVVSFHVGQKFKHRVTKNKQ